MRKILSILGLGFLGLIGLLLIAAVLLASAGGRKLSGTYEVLDTSLSVDIEQASLERGKYLVTAACLGCHGDNLAGNVLFDEPALGTFYAPNLTAGAGGVGGSYSSEDFVRAIRYGVSPDGTALVVMPSKGYWHYDDADLAAIIAYIGTLPPVDQNYPDKAFTFFGRTLMGIGVFDGMFGADFIDLNNPPPPAPVRAVTAEYGEYLVNIGGCSDCHGETLSGGVSAEPNAPPGTNLTPGGELIGWDNEDFLTLIMTGKTPTGREVEGMPWQSYAKLTEDDLSAIFLFLESLPALESTVP
jgi:mono/diheme cytochrome c family protein